MVEAERELARDFQSLQVQGMNRQFMYIVLVIGIVYAVGFLSE